MKGEEMVATWTRMAVQTKKNRMMKELCRHVSLLHLL